MIFVLLS